MADIIERKHAIKLDWDKSYTDLLMEPHLRSSTPLRFPVFAVHIAMWRPSPAEHADLSERNWINGLNDILGRVGNPWSENDPCSERKWLPGVSGPKERSNDFERDYHEQNVARDVEAVFEGTLFVFRLEHHRDYCSISVFLPRCGCMLDSRPGNNEFWQAFSGSQVTDQTIAEVYARGRAHIAKFLREVAGIHLPDGPPTEAAAKVPHVVGVSGEFRAGKIFAHFESLTAPESIVAGSPEKQTAFRLDEGRFSVDSTEAEALLRNVTTSAATSEALFRGNWRDLVACGMLNGQALYVSSLGNQAIGPSILGQPIRFLLLYSRELADENDSRSRSFDWPFSRLLNRINEIGTRRLAALRDVKVLWHIGGTLRDIERSVEGIDPYSASFEGYRDLKKNLRQLVGLREALADTEVRSTEVTRDKKRIPSLYNRIARARHYASDVKQLVDGLGVVALPTFQDYKQFVQRRLYHRFDYVERLGDRLDGLHNRIRALLEFQNTENAIRYQHLADRVAPFILGAGFAQVAYLTIQSSNDKTSSWVGPAVVIGGFVTGILLYAVLHWIDRKRW